MRRAELVLVSVILVAIALAALVAEQLQPMDVLDVRRSTLLDGPQGASGLARALERLAVPVEQRRRPLFDWEIDDGDGPALLALLDVSVLLTPQEERVVRNWVARGNTLVLAGGSGVERCFGLEIDQMIGPDDPGIAIVAPEGTEVVPSVRAVVRRLPFDSLRGFPGELSEACPLLAPIDVDTLVRTVDGRAAVLRLTHRRGGQTLVLGDSRLVSNRVLKETDIGVALLPWLLDTAPRRVVFDEYHHGFQQRRSILAATWSWALGSPVGWLMLQLIVVGLLAVGYSAVRFGPALTAVERRRRSPLEHLDALAAGLERSRGDDAAVALLSRGLQRRLVRMGTLGGAGGTERDWVARLALAVRTPPARAAVARLGKLVQEGGKGTRVLELAQTVEDVWQFLGHESRPSSS